MLEALGWDGHPDARRTAALSTMSIAAVPKPELVEAFFAAARRRLRRADRRARAGCGAAIRRRGRRSGHLGGSRRIDRGQVGAHLDAAVRNRATGVGERRHGSDCPRVCPSRVSRTIMCACILDSFRNATARLAGRGRWGYTIAWEGRSRLNVRWGAGLPLSIACHPPAQVTRFGTLGTGAD